MKPPKKLTYQKWGIAALGVLFSIFIFYLNALAPYLPGDDHIFMMKIPVDGILGSESISSFTDLVESQTNFYYNYHYRIWNHTLLQILLLCPSWVFDLLNTLVYLLIPAVLLRESKSESNLSYLQKYLGLLFFIWIFHFDLGRCYFLTTGSTNYSWLLIPQLLYISELFRFDRDRGHNALLISLAAINMMANENALVVLFLLTVYFAIKLRNHFLSISAFILFAGGVFMLMSPSLDRRIATEGFRDVGLWSHLSEYGLRSAYYYLRYLPILLLVTWHKGILKNERSFLLLASVIIANAIMLFVPLFEPRSAVFGFFVLLMWAVHHWSIFNKHLFSGLLFLGVFIAFQRLPDFKDLSERHIKNELLLKASTGQDSVALHPYCDRSRRDYLLCHEISNDPSYIDNRSLSNAYQITRVTLNNSYNQEFYFSEFTKNLQQDSSFVLPKPVLQNPSLRIRLQEKTIGKSIMISSSDKTIDKYIIRGNNGSLKHKMLSCMPYTIQLYFLDYLESDLVDSTNSIIFHDAEFHYHHLKDYLDYEYLLISGYSMTDHAPIGKVFKLNCE